MKFEDLKNIIEDPTASTREKGLCIEIVRLRDELKRRPPASDARDILRRDVFLAAITGFTTSNPQWQAESIVREAEKVANAAVRK